MRVYTATVIWDDLERSIPVQEASDVPLAGMALLYGHSLLVHIVDGGQVVIDRLP